MERFCGSIAKSALNESAAVYGSATLTGLTYIKIGLSGLERQKTLKSLS